MGKDSEIIISNEPIPLYMYQYFCMTGIPFSGNVEGIGYIISEIVITPYSNNKSNIDNFNVLYRKSYIQPIEQSKYLEHTQQGIGEYPEMSNKQEIPSVDYWIGLSSSIGEMSIYDIKADRWLGKDGRFHSFYEMPTRLKKIGNPQNALKWAKRLSVVGRVLTVYSAYDLAKKWYMEDIGYKTVTVEAGSIIAGMKLKGLYSIAWSVGWELGRLITQTEWYQRERFAIAYRLWEAKFGPPKDSNLYLWVHFFETYEESLK